LLAILARILPVRREKLMNEQKTRQNKIIAATVGPMPTGVSDPMPTITVTFEDGKVKELFSFYPDEIYFSESEFIGLTEEEARALRHEKDIAYLRS
jgi:hypothetical protein